MPCLRERRRSARLPPRPDAERYVHTARNLTFPMGDIVVGIGSHSLARDGPKVDFRPERRLRPRRRDDHQRSKSRTDAERWSSRPRMICEEGAGVPLGIAK